MAKFISMGADVVTEWTVSEFMQAGMNLKSAKTLPNIDQKKEIERIRTQAELKINIAGISHGLIDKNELTNTDSLTLTNKELIIVSFTLFIAGQEMKSSGSNLTNEVKHTIQKSQSGEFLVFDNIKVMDKDEVVRQLVSLTLKLRQYCCQHQYLQDAGLKVPCVGSLENFSHNLPSVFIFFVILQKRKGRLLRSVFIESFGFFCPAFSQYPTRQP